MPAFWGSIMDDETFEMPPLSAVIPLHMTVPLIRSDDLAEGDLVVFPDCARLFRIGEILEDGSYGGDVCRADNLNFLLAWEWYTPDEMIALGMRIFKPTSTVH